MTIIKYIYIYHIYILIYIYIISYHIYILCMYIYIHHMCFPQDLPLWVHLPIGNIKASHHLYLNPGHERQPKVWKSKYIPKNGGKNNNNINKPWAYPKTGKHVDSLWSLQYAMDWFKGNSTFETMFSTIKCKVNCPLTQANELCRY
jgi:hypothetical protein